LIKRLTLLLSLVLSLAFASTAVTAQTPEITADDLEGLQSMAIRMFLQSEENVTGAINDGSGIPPVVAATGAFIFDSDENAERALEPVTEVFATEMVSSLGVSLDDMSQGEPVEDLGDNAELRHVMVTQSGLEMTVDILTVQEDETIFLFVTMVVGANQETFTMDLAELVLDAGVSDSAVEFDASGASTGGAFDAFPTEGDEILQGMEVQADMYESDPALGTPAA
jgi:hypothetical protein